jgi:hypothetical protein
VAEYISNEALPSKQKRKYQPRPLDSVNKDEFFAKLKIANPKAAILSLIPGYSLSFLPDTSGLPLFLTELYKPEYLDLPYHELLIKCEEIFNELQVSEEQALNLEKETRDQAKSKLWFKQRAGRITASRFKSVVSTDVAMPSQSLVKSICYPEAFQFNSDATK